MTISTRAELDEVVDGEVVDAEIVDDEAAVSQAHSGADRRGATGPDGQDRRKHDHTKMAGRNPMYIPLGALVAPSACGTPGRRPGSSGSSGRTNRQATTRPRWTGRTLRMQFIKDRHQRRMDLIETPQQVMLAIPQILLGMFIMLAVLGIFLAFGTKHFAELILTPFKVVAGIVEWAAIAVSVTCGPVLLALPWIGMGALWWAGRAHANANMTGWMVPRKSDDDTGLVVTADTIVLALQNLPNRRTTAGVQGGMAADVPYPAGAGWTRVCGRVQPPARRDRRDGCRPAAGAGPERPPGRGRGMAVRRRAGRYRAGRARLRYGSPTRACCPSPLPSTR